MGKKTEAVKVLFDLQEIDALVRVSALHGHTPSGYLRHIFLAHAGSPEILKKLKEQEITPNPFLSCN
jgi:hypothetical protein